MGCVNPMLSNKHMTNSPPISCTTTSIAEAHKAKRKGWNIGEGRLLCSLSPGQPALVKYLQQTDSEEDYGKDWDPHAGTKPSPLDGEASDEEWDPEDDADGIGSGAFNI